MKNNISKYEKSVEFEDGNTNLRNPKSMTEAMVMSTRKMLNMKDEKTMETAMAMAEALFSDDSEKRLMEMKRPKTTLEKKILGKVSRTAQGMLESTRELERTIQEVEEIVKSGEFPDMAYLGDILDQDALELIENVSNDFVLIARLSYGRSGDGHEELQRMVNERSIPRAKKLCDGSPYRIDEVWRNLLLVKPSDVKKITPARTRN